LSVTTRDVEDIAAARRVEEYVLDVRHNRTKHFEEWKSRVDEGDKLYNGDFSTVYPNEIERQDAAKVMNLVQVGMDDLTKLAAETQPQVRCAKRGDSDADKENANLRAGVLNTHWIANEGDDNLDTELGYDLAGPGGAFVAVTFNPDESEYPIYTRLDPRGCYPGIVRNKLVDMLVVTRMKARDAEREYGFSLFEGENALFSEPVRQASSDEVEILDHYDRERVVSVVATVKRTGGDLGEGRQIGKTWVHGLGVVPVGWSKMPTLDGEFRGAFDQVKGIMIAQHRIVQLMLDYAEQMVYSPFEAWDVENDDEAPGPTTVYRLRSKEGFMRRVSPAGSQPELFTILEYLERQGRSGAAYPAQRQGEVNQSIASAAFVSSTLGQLTTQIKAVQKAKAALRRRCNVIAMMIDERFLDNAKPLLVPVGDIATYKPSDVIKGVHQNRVVYGAGAGLDAINKKIAVLQDVGAGLTSKRTAREQIDYIDNIEGEEAQIEMEQFLEVAAEKLRMQAPVSTLMQVVGLLDQGKRLAEVMGIVAPIMEQVEAQQAQAAAGGAAGNPAVAGPPPGGPPGVAGAQGPQGVQGPFPAQQFRGMTPPASTGG
jgi:hypothetical protein